MIPKRVNSCTCSLYQSLVIILHVYFEPCQSIDIHILLDLVYHRSSFYERAVKKHEKVEVLPASTGIRLGHFFDVPISAERLYPQNLILI